MKLKLSTALVTAFMAMGCASKEFKNVDRLPQSEPTGTGSIGSGGDMTKALTEIYGRVLSAVTVDLNEDGTMDRAILSLSPGKEDADLYIILSVTEANPQFYEKKGIVWAGTMWGTLPSLKVNQRGSIVVESENVGIGRFKWNQSMTIVLRQNQLLVGGFSYNYFDGIDPEKGGSCDLNLLAGKGVRNGKALNQKFRPEPLTTWSDNKVPAPCRFE